jgi:hypothetical protein
LAAGRSRGAEIAGLGAAGRDLHLKGVDMKRVFLAFAVTLGLWSQAHAVCLDQKGLDGIFKANVDAEGFVAYDAIRINKGGDLYEAITFMEDADLSQCTEGEKLAFWINAYNAHMIRLVLARPQMKSISEDFKLFGEKFKIARHNLSLNDIEHRVLRSSPKKGGPIPGLSLPKFDPRVHFALVWGAFDSPRLSNHAYNGNTIEEQLQTAAVNFANTPKYVRVENDKVVLPSSMKWYADDFQALGGVGAYLAALTDTDHRPDEKVVDEKLLAPEFPANADFHFDWTVNSRSNKPK